MVGPVRGTASIIDSSGNLVKSGSTAPKTTSVDSYYIDPDLLIREYFLSSSTQRAKSRKRIARSVSSLKSVLAVLSWGISGKASDAYDGAVDLLAEVDNVDLLIATSKYLEATSELSGNSSKSHFLESLWEILIKAIACAYQIPVEQRFKLILNLITVSNRRIFKATIIDALTIIADEMNTESIRNLIGRFASIYEADQYIRNYAQEALQDIS